VIYPKNFHYLEPTEVSSTALPPLHHPSAVTLPPPAYFPKFPFSPLAILFAHHVVTVPKDKCLELADTGQKRKIQQSKERKKP
jgi:hypothetical protein